MSSLPIRFITATQSPDVLTYPSVETLERPIQQPKKAWLDSLHILPHNIEFQSRKVVLDFRFGHPEWPNRE